LISDAVAIICLGKTNNLWLLKVLFKTIFIPASVKKEVLVEGKEGYSNILGAIEEGWVKVIEPKTNINLGLGAGENDAITLARERKDTVILDDAFAIKVAKVLNIPTIRTTTAIFLAVNKKAISKDEAIAILNSLIESGYYISPKEYSVILTRLKQ